MQEEVKKELEEMGSPLAGQKVGLPYGEPKDYFAGMPGRLAAMMAEEQVANSLPAAGNPYAIPGGYFEALPARVLAAAKQKEKSRGVVTFRQLRIAAAAVVLLAVGVGTFVGMIDNTAKATGGAILANVDDKDIKDYLGNAATPLADVTAAGYIDEIDVKTEDIEKYLDENGWDAEMTF